MNETTLNILSQNIDTLWVINCAILVFIMQAGFMCMESGLSRHKNSINVALKNAADFGVSVVMFWLFGFGLMFGTSYKGIIGTDLFFFKQISLSIKLILFFRQCLLQLQQPLYQVP